MVVGFANMEIRWIMDAELKIGCNILYWVIKVGYGGKRYPPIGQGVIKLYDMGRLGCDG